MTKKALRYPLILGTITTIQGGVNLGVMSVNTPEKKSAANTEETLAKTAAALDRSGDYTADKFPGIPDKIDCCCRSEID